MRVWSRGEQRAHPGAVDVLRVGADTRRCTQRSASVFGECQVDSGGAEPVDALTSAALFGEGFGDVRVGAPPRRVLPPPRRKPLMDRPALAGRKRGQLLLQGSILRGCS